MKAITTIIHDARRQKKDGTYPVKLRVTYDRQQKYYLTSYSLTVSDFEKVQGAKPRNEHKELALKLQAFEKKAADIIDSLPLFTWQAFEKQYLTNRAAKNTIELAFTEYAKELRETGRIGTAVTYECAQNSLSKFAGGGKFADVTPDFLRKYEKWMLDNGSSVTTIGIYLRNLRALFNSAIANGMLSKEYYPFGKKRYEIPASKNAKKALTLSDIAKIYHYQPKPNTTTAMAKDYWIFMYLCNGINVKDMCLLKYDNIKGDILEFERAKTIRTKRQMEAIRIPLAEDAKAIIEKWGNTVMKGSNNTYIFPVLTNELSPEREMQLIKQLTHTINDHMKVVAKTLGIPNDLTTYVARHSFATILQRSGVSTEFISEALGHSNVKTTQNYLAGFEDDSKKEALKALTAFKENI